MDCGLYQARDGLIRLTVVSLICSFLYRLIVWCQILKGVLGIEPYNYSLISISPWYKTEGLCSYIDWCVNITHVSVKWHLFINLSNCSSESYLVHHLNGTGLHRAPSNCVVHHGAQEGPDPTFFHFLVVHMEHAQNVHSLSVFGWAQGTSMGLCCAMVHMMICHIQYQLPPTCGWCIIIDVVSLDVPISDLSFWYEHVIVGMDSSWSNSVQEWNETFHYDMERAGAGNMDKWNKSKSI